MSMSNMPAKIYLTDGSVGWPASMPEAGIHAIAYVRADIVEAMAGALKLISDGRPENPIGDPWSFYDDLVQIASDALNPYREATNDKA